MPKRRYPIDLPQYGHGMNTEIIAAIQAKIKRNGKTARLPIIRRTKPAISKVQKMILIFLYLLKASWFIVPH